ncbi:sugar kinase [Labedella endophytica]|uniref:Sugar kinase n=2 Tax=Labedella endophytica TaxID=1523160 RepID=A0A3S0VIV5_9MICO|nr:sugar kinase [Labedella endophytica]
MDTDRVVVIGDALIDELRDETGTREFVGGAALNVAVGLARLGVRTTLLAMVGDDEDGASIRAFLDTHGVDLIATASPHGSSRAVSERVDGEPHYVFNTAAQNRHIDFGADEQAAIDGAAFIVVSCFPFDDDAQTAELEAAIGDGSRFVVDPNPREAMMADRERFERNALRLSGRALLVKVGDDDAPFLGAVGLDDLVPDLTARGARIVLATEGRAGARIIDGGVTVSSGIASLPGAVVDTMGAGDASLASLVSDIVRLGRPVDAAGWSTLLDRAMLVAAATCRSEGALLQTPDGFTAL